jgi:hypothetical protein
MQLSDDGNRAYIADPTGHSLMILDTSEIQARKADPQAKEISRLTWDRASIPQNAIPFTKGGHPYVLEFDEYNASTLSDGSADDVGAGRIIDIADETKPKVVSNLRLQINEPEDHAKYGSDPGADGEIGGGAQGYAAHYCNIPTRVNPTLVACSFIASGLRLFDISDLDNPKEVGYFVAPTQARAENGNRGSAYAMSMPAFVPARKEVWFTDGTSGFYALRLTNGAWPAAKARHRRCGKRRTLLVGPLPRGAKAQRVWARFGGKNRRVLAHKQRGRFVRVTVAVPLRRPKRQTLHVFVGLRGGGGAFEARRVMRACVPS